MTEKILNKANEIQTQINEYKHQIEYLHSYKPIIRVGVKRLRVQTPYESSFPLDETDISALIELRSKKIVELTKELDSLI